MNETENGADVEFHDLANLFPMIASNELDALANDIKENGQLEAIVLYEGKILDGRNRYNACIKACVEPLFVLFDGQDPVAFVVSKNMARRHLDESQRAMVAAKLATLKDGQRKSGGQICPPSQPEAATLLNVGTRSVKSARAVMQHGTEDLIRAVENGGIAVSQAAKLAKAKPEFQRSVIHKMRTDNVRPQEAARRVKAETIAKEELASPSGKYRVIYADPPWSYGNTSLDEYVEQRDHYPVMQLDEICRLPVRDMAQDDAVLFIWVTSPVLEESFQVINAWGFKYKASFVWDKIAHNMGHYNSVRHEFMLVCVRGSCQPDVRNLHDSVLSIERTGHSVKPEQFRKIIDEIYPIGSRVELFARRKTDGWDAWGYEAD